jgi:hypothetical protein
MLNMINLSNNATAIRDLTNKELEQVQLYAESYGFEVFEFNGDYIFSKGLVEKKSLVSVHYSISVPDDEVYNAHVYIIFTEKAYSLKEMKRFMNIVNSAYAIAEMIVKIGSSK